MATSEALIKYYDCLRDSFNRIQLKDNQTALINAALRPKIIEEFAKSKDVLVSYLNYIQVFTLIYSDKFQSLCINIFCPLFKISAISANDSNSNKQEDVANLVHKTIKEILKSKPELIDEYIHSVIKFFPNIYSDGHDTFIYYLGNSLEVCGYVRGQPLTNLMAKILDRINPPSKNLGTDEDKLAEIESTINESYDLIHIRLDNLEPKQRENVSAAILAAYARDFLTSSNQSSLNFLILYICSTQSELLDLFINLLWAAFTDIDRPFEDRRASVLYASSFMSRASYVGLDKVLNYLETATIWCMEFFEEKRPDNELFYSLVRSILYLITQRYREMYEQESIDRLKQLDLDRILESPLKPLEHCDTETEQRFWEVATLYGISALRPSEPSLPARKKRKSDSGTKRFSWRAPFRETNTSLPERVRNLYRNYYDHRNFTVYRE